MPRERGEGEDRVDPETATCARRREATGKTIKGEEKSDDHKRTHRNIVRSSTV